MLLSEDVQKVPLQKINKQEAPVLYYCAHIKPAYVQLIPLLQKKSLVRNNLGIQKTSHFS